MIARRTLLLAGGAYALTPSGLAQGTKLSFRGSLEQGGLVIGQTLPGAVVVVDERQVLVSVDGIFTFGLAYDSTKLIRVMAKFADGTSQTGEVQAKARQYEIQRIEGVPEKYVEPPPDVQERMARERARIVEARKRETGGTDFITALEWPFGGRLSGVYGSQRILNGKPMAPHLGVDVAAPEGTPIHAAADAVVSISDDFYLEGGFTLLDHGHGISTCYLHQSKRLVVEGQKVRRGEAIGLVGMTGRATGPHCHWGLCWFQLKLDPSRATRTPTPPAA